jgi:hypothetical protein
MSRTHRGYQVVAAAAVVVTWTILYVVVVINSEHPPAPESVAKVNRELALLLAVPTALWVVAALLLVHYWWAGAGARLSATDAPGQILELAITTLPDNRLEWGVAMTAELAEVTGRSARWRFALGCAGAALWPPRGGRAVFALGVGLLVLAVTMATGSVVEDLVPGMAVFAAAFVALVGALVLLGVARSRSPRWPAWVPALVGVGCLAAVVVSTATFLLRYPEAANHLTPQWAAYLAVVLTGCLWIAVAPPRPLVTGWLAPLIGVGAAIILVLAIDNPINRVLITPAGVCFAAAFVAGAVGRSFRVGAQAAVWTTFASGLIAYALWLPEEVRRYAANGGQLWDGAVAPIGEILSDALFWCLVIAPVLALPLGVIGAAAGASTGHHDRQSSRHGGVATAS